MNRNDHIGNLISNENRNLDKIENDIKDIKYKIDIRNINKLYSDYLNKNTIYKWSLKIPYFLLIILIIVLIIDLSGSLSKNIYITVGYLVPVLSYFIYFGIKTYYNTKIYNKMKSEYYLKK